MKTRIIVAVAAVALLAASPVRAADVSLKLAEGTQSAIVQLPGVFDQCVAGITIHGDATVCKSVAGFLLGLSNEVRSAQAEVAKVAADKAAADKAATDKPAAPADTAPAK